MHSKVEVLGLKRIDLVSDNVFSEVDLLRCVLLLRAYLEVKLVVKLLGRLNIVFLEVELESGLLLGLSSSAREVSEPPVAHG